MGMHNKYKGKVAIITGSRQGIGKTIAWTYASMGASVVLNARNAEKLEITQKEFQDAGFNSIAIAGDVSNWDFCQELCEKAKEQFGRIDIIITNAAIATRGNMESLNPDIYQKMININILGSVYPAKAAIPYLKETKGSIQFISSIASYYGIPFNGIYSATKNAINSIAQATHNELKPDGVFVGVTYVGFTENETTKQILDTDGKVVVLPQRNNVKKQNRNAVANSIISQIENKKFKKTLTLTGKVLMLLSRFTPRLLKFIYKANLKKIELSSK